MRSQFQFLQSEDDENEFLEAFIKEADMLKKESDTQWWFCIGDCRIQFLRSSRSVDKIALGSIAIGTHGGLESYSNAAQTEKLFKRMRAWLKKRYVNQLAAENINFPGNSTSYRMTWLGPDARAKYRSSQVTLRSILSGPVVIKEEPNQLLQAPAR